MQRCTSLILKHTDPEHLLGRGMILALAKEAGKMDVGLEERLLKVARLEATLAPAEAIFGHLQARSGQTVAEVAKGLVEQWAGPVPHLNEESFRELIPELENVSGREIANSIMRCDRAMREGRYEDAIAAVLDWNRLVMASRSAAPWVRVQTERLDVRYRSIERLMPGADQLPTLWRNPYYLDSLRNITFQLRGGD